MAQARRSFAFPATFVFLGAALLHCSNSSAPTGTPSGAVGDDGAVSDDGGASDGGSANDVAAACFPDNDGINGGDYTFVLTVDDSGFSKLLLATQNDAQATLVLTNNGTTPHGFKVGCTSVAPAYPDLPAGCPTITCFPDNASIPPLAPGASATITFDTPNPDGLIYPFTSNEPADSAVPGLTTGQWSLM